MKLKLSTISILILSLFIGCQSEEVSDLQIKENNVQVLLSAEELLCLQYMESPELDQAEMFDLLLDFQNKKNGINEYATRNNEISFFKIKKKYYMKEENSSDNNCKTRKSEEELLIPIYEINIVNEKGNGLAIISADRRTPHILAFIDKIDEKGDSLSLASNALLEWAKVCIAHEVDMFETSKDSIYAGAISKLSSELGLNSEEIVYSKIKEQIVTKDVDTRSTPIDYPPSNLQVLRRAGPFCPVTWDQRQPYNCKLPMGDVDVFFGWTEYTNYPTGIGVLSIAHLMAILEPALSRRGSIIDWDYLTENETIIAPDYFNSGDPLEKREMVGNLFKKIYNATESSPVINANGVVTGTTTYINKIESYIKQLFDINGISSWNISSIRNSIMTNTNPVYAYGKADNNASNGVYPFLIDGMMDCRGRINNVPKDIDITYLHANFGFGDGWQDGYYLMELNNSSAIFETNIPLIFKSEALTIIHNIRNK